MKSWELSIILNQKPDKDITSKENQRTRSFINFKKKKERKKENLKPASKKKKKKNHGQVGCIQENQTWFYI